MRWIPVSLSSLLPQNVASKFVPLSVNYFPHRKCNYRCDFCFHTTKNLSILPLEEAKRGLRLLTEAGMKKLNISGGEPFLQPTFIGEVFKFCKTELGLESCSVVNNGSKVTEKWLDSYGQYLDVMAISCDSFDPDTNIALGRADNGKGTHIRRVFLVAECLNWEEDMNPAIDELAPFRWKVFQVLLLDGENTGVDTKSLRDARNLVITNDQFQEFLRRHQGQNCLVPEDNSAMKDSYLNLDESMRFLDCRDGGKSPGRSLLDVGVDEALKGAGFDEQAFVARGGIFDWSRRVKKGTDLEW
ncbi:hypothetical protein OF83DRAFT_1058879 [Amylostereum chailletii]|nr:hypothetical protein OF83DRAFT_1058879 [Amylostereum chailletii]